MGFELKIKLDPYTDNKIDKLSNTRNLFLFPKPISFFFPLVYNLYK